MLRGFKLFVSMARPAEVTNLIRRQRSLGGDMIAGTPRFPVYRIELNSQAKPTLLIFSGHHGDEPAGPMGVMEYLEDNPITDVRILAFPLLNPAGYERKERKDRKGHDLNRQFYANRGDARKILKAIEGETVRMALSCHEDPELKAFYLYYNRCKGLAQKIRDKAEDYFPINQAKKRKSLPKDRKPEPWEEDYCLIKDGMIGPPHINRHTIEDWLADRRVPTIVTETPGQAELPDRVKFIKEAILTTAEYVRRTT